MKLVAMTCAALLARHRPHSTSAKPACMNITRKPVMSVHMILRVTLLWATFLTSSLSAAMVFSPLESIPGSPVVSPVFGSALAGAGHCKSEPVPRLAPVPVESGCCGGAGASAGAAAAGAAAAGGAAAGVSCAWIGERQHIANRSPAPARVRGVRMICFSFIMLFLS